MWSDNLTDLGKLEQTVVEADVAAALEEERSSLLEDLLVDEEDSWSRFIWRGEHAVAVVVYPRLILRTRGEEALVVLVEVIGQSLRVGGGVVVHLERRGVNG